MNGNEYWVYVLSSDSGTLYIGMTNNLSRRVWEHQEELTPSFTQKYHCHRLVYFEQYSSVEEAIAREKQLKNWNRQKKEKLIRSLNPHWNDLRV